MILGGLCFEYAVTKDPAVKQIAWHMFEGMEMLYNVCRKIISSPWTVDSLIVLCAGDRNRWLDGS